MRTLDIAQLYLRIAVGGMLILHNIGKLQDYNEIISNYPNYYGLASSFYFLLFAAVESVAAIMLIVGWRVRLAAALLIVGTIFALIIYFPNHTNYDVELNAIYTFIYIYILISGGGTYSFDSLRSKHHRTA